jgi:hypothetical protein
MMPSVTRLFATSLAAGSIRQEPGLSGELHAAILAQYSIETDAMPLRVGQSWQSREDMSQWGGAGAKRLQGLLAAAADRLTIDKGRKSGSRYDWHVSLRAQVARGGEAATTKHRPDAFWGGLCFLDDGYEGSQDPLAGGDVEIEDPRLPITLMEAPELRLRLDLKASITYRETARVRPVRDRLLLYPGWLRIGHLPFNGPGERTWIAIDLVARRRMA